MLIFQEFPELFKGVWKFKDFKLKSHIIEQVKPVAQAMYKIPYSLRDKVGKQLVELESQNIIERVNDKTPWVISVMVVPKPNGDIWICVEMRQSNTEIVRETHPILSVDEILYKNNVSYFFTETWPQEWLAPH